MTVWMLEVSSLSVALLVHPLCARHTGALGEELAATSTTSMHCSTCRTTTCMLAERASRQSIRRQATAASCKCVRGGTTAPCAAASFWALRCKRTERFKPRKPSDHPKVYRECAVALHNLSWAAPLSTLWGFLPVGPPPTQRRTPGVGCRLNRAAAHLIVAWLRVGPSPGDL